MNGNHLSIWLRPDGFSYRADDGERLHVPLAPAGGDYHRRLADAMLAEDALLADYATTDCLVLTTRFVLVPPDADGATAEAMYRLALTEAPQPEALLRDGPILFGLDHECYHFMQRTFAGDVAYRHPLGRLRALCGDMADAPSSPPSPDALTLAPAQFVVGVQTDAIDLLVYRSSALLLANRYQTAELASMAYYIMNTWQRCELDALRDHLILTGDTSLAARLRVQLAPMVKNLRVQTYQEVDKSMPD